MPENDPIVLRREIKRLQEQNKELRNAFRIARIRADQVFNGASVVEDLSTEHINRAIAFSDGLKALSVSVPSTQSKNSNLHIEKLNQAIDQFWFQIRKERTVPLSRNPWQEIALERLGVYLSDREDCGDGAGASYIRGVMDGLEVAFHCRFGKDAMEDALAKATDLFPRPDWLPGEG